MISFVYFDLGGVVEKDFTATNKWEDLCDELHIPTEYRNSFREFWDKEERVICTTTPVDDLLPILKEKFHAQVATDYSLLEGFVKRLEKNPGIWPIIEEIKKTKKVGLLTNMYIGMRAALVTRGIIPDIHWNIVIDSTEVGYIKPDTAIFQIAQEKAAAQPGEILFIENTPRHVNAAKALGWKTFFYDSSDYEKANKDLATFWQHLTKSS